MTSLRLFKFIANMVSLSLFCVPSIVKAQSDSCIVEIYSNKVISVKLLNSNYCPRLFFDGTGFVIFSEFTGNEFTKIIWGEASIDTDICYFKLIDMDKDGINEVLTIFSFDTTFWGYIHKLEIDSLSNVSISSIEIPDSLSSKFDYLGNIEIADDGSIVIHGDPEDDNQQITITFDTKIDSMIIR